MQHDVRRGCPPILLTNYQSTADTLVNENTFVVYTQAEVDAKVNPLVARIDNLERCIVEALNKLAAVNAGEKIEASQFSCLPN